MITPDDSGQEIDPTAPKHRMVARVAQILEMVAREQAGLSLTEIAHRCSAPVSSVQTLVGGLVETGYLTRRARRYTLGPAPYVLNMLAQRPPVRSVRRSDLEVLHQITGQTILLGIVVGGEAFYIEHVTNDPRYAYLAESRVPRPLLRTSVGRALLAHMDDRDMHEILRRSSEADSAVVDEFLHELPKVRESGLVTSKGLVGPEYWGIATPIREDGIVVAAVGLLGRRAEMEGRFDTLGELLLDHAREWSERSFGASAGT